MKLLYPHRLVVGVQQSLESANVTWEFTQFGGTVHAFTEPNLVGASANAMVSCLLCHSLLSSTDDPACCFMFGVQVENHSETRRQPLLHFHRTLPTDAPLFTQAFPSRAGVMLLACPDPFVL